MTVLDSLFKNHDIDHWGLVPLTTPLSLEFYKTWLNKEYHGEMSYLKNHLPAKETPTQLLPKAQSALVFTVNYGTTPSPLPLSNLKIASYAQDEDYHFWLKQKIESICKDLVSLYPKEHFIGFTDSSPVMERDLAYRAGLGWFGKNTCIIDRRRGSFFFIAEIYSTLLESQKKIPSHDHCGTCNRCIEACPTQAIESPRLLNATKCISYWTIESKKIPPPELREKFSGWFFGCDICQTVCPWNIKIRDFAEKPETPVEGLVQELQLILESSNKKLQRLFQKTPLLRAGGRGLKRNALIVIANKKLTPLTSLVSHYVKDPELGELAQWTLDKLLKPE